MGKLKPIEKITLKPGIYDFTGDIRAAIIQTSPISGELENVLATFNRRYDLVEDIERRGEEILTEEIDTALDVFDFEMAKEAVNEGLSRAQSLNPDIILEQFPIVFLFVPSHEDAKSLHGQGCAININVFTEGNLSKEIIQKLISSFVAHEATHVFLRQMGLQPPYEQETLKESIYDFLWEEGLTTYMETQHYKFHDQIVKESEFWLQRIEIWFSTEDEKVKEKLLNEMLESPSCKNWFNCFNLTLERFMPEGLSLDEQFRVLLTKWNGPAYHIGYSLWEKQIEKGSSLKDLVMKGSGEVEVWIKESLEQ